MKKLILATAILIGLSGVAQAKIELKGWYWGKPMDRAYIKVNETIADVPAVWQILADIKAPTLKATSISITFKSEYFNDVKAALITKYKLVCETRKVQNRMGATFLAEDCMYEEDGDTLLLNKFSEKLTQSAIWIYNNKDLEKSSKESVEKRNKDL